MPQQEETNQVEAKPDHALTNVPDPQQRQSLGAPMSAMADALRANAEALRVLHANQRKMDDTIQKNDRGSQVVASTRALNETFRGLSEIQKGLLDAVVKGRRSGGGMGGATFVLAFLLLAGLTGVAGVFVLDKFTGDEKISKALYEEAKKSADSQAGQIEELKARLKTTEESDRAGGRELADMDKQVAGLEKDKEDLERRLVERGRELESNKAQLQNFLQVKQQADLAGQLQVRNMQLEQDNRRMREKMNSLEGARDELLNNFGNLLLEMRGGDKEAILQRARKMGVYKEPEVVSREPGAPVPLGRRGEKLVKDYLNRLFPDDEHSFMLLGVESIKAGTTLHEVTLAEYKRGTMVKSLICKELTIRCDVESDTIEIRLLGGYLVNTNRPRERIPFSEDGHSEFLADVGLKSWIRRHSPYVEIDENGMLTWKSTPS